MATVFKISGVYFHHVATQVTETEIENITQFYMFYDLRKSFHIIALFSPHKTLENGHYYFRFHVRKLIINEGIFCQRSFI